ncbi:hypothetical protein tinsulaeT_06130 [Thalassotalea insulae]|uniref:Uncharacterized protein n=1 Tax=Thalassotalea insulae TaxID=2056778 RepID=A0ABQ6GMQ2_9GAMM|nr:hypothetical protein [Thalassotalea insulae]GLX77273.1 hypothetical protein tinsulaeT_06130 [Thalassotalea insulae]
MHNLIFRCLCFFSCIFYLTSAVAQPLAKVINSDYVIHSSALAKVDAASALVNLGNVEANDKVVAHTWSSSVFIDYVWHYFKIIASGVHLIVVLVLYSFTLLARQLRFFWLRHLTYYSADISQRAAC